MKGKIIIWLAGTLLLVGLEYYRKRDLRKSLIASGTFAWIASMATVGITLRPILPLFALHYLLVLLSWGSLDLLPVMGKIPVVDVDIANCDSVGLFGIEFFGGGTVWLNENVHFSWASGPLCVGSWLLVLYLGKFPTF